MDTRYWRIEEYRVIPDTAGRTGRIMGWGTGDRQRTGRGIDKRKGRANAE